MSNGTRIGIVLSGTAPAMTLMSGAMLAFAKYNVEFDVISTTGVGGLIGLLYLAPKGKTREQALRELPNLFVSDWLYRFVPVNFKVFHKYGPLAPAFYELRKSLPKFNIAPDDPSPLRRFANDWMDLWATVLTPPSLGTASNGLMSHVPLIDDLVDFKALPATKSKTKFYLNAFSLYHRRLQIYDNDTVNGDVYKGAQAMFMLFPPVKAGSDLLVTGASHDPTGLQAIWTKERDLWAVLALDAPGKYFWRMPTDVYDAFQLMLMNPIAALQQLMFALYSKTEKLVNALPGSAPPPGPTPTLPRLFGMPVTIDPADYPTMLKWTYENAVALQDVGYRAALRIAQVLAERPDRATLEHALFPYRFADSLLTTQPRSLQFLQGIFNPIFENFPRFIERLHTPPHGHEVTH